MSDRDTQTKGFAQLLLDDINRTLEEQFDKTLYLQPHVRQAVAQIIERAYGLDEQFVRNTIKQMIEQREKRLNTLKSTYPRDLGTIGKVEHGIMTLIELEHNLRLCGCPDEAYVKSV